MVEQDIDEDRYISPEHYLFLLKLFPTLSKNQFYFITLAETGWRPHEVCRTHIDHFNFEDLNDPKVKWKIGKPTQIIKSFNNKLCPNCKGTGKVETYEGKEIECSLCVGTGKSGAYLEKRYKLKWRLITPNFARLVQEYIKLHALEIGASGGFLFPSRQTFKGDFHVDVTTMQCVLQRLRDEYFKRYNWMKEPFKTVYYPNGRKQYYYKLSLYSFRKLHATQWARELLNRGYTDILLMTAQHMGHSNPRTTMRYIKQLIDERPIVNSAFRKIQRIFNIDISRIDKAQTLLNNYF